MTMRPRNYVIERASDSDRWTLAVGPVWTWDSMRYATELRVRAVAEKRYRYLAVSVHERDLIKFGLSVRGELLAV